MIGAQVELVVERRPELGDIAVDGAPGESDAVSSNFEDRIGQARQVLSQAHETFAQAGPRLRLAAIAPEKAAELLPRRGLVARQIEVGEQAARPAAGEIEPRAARPAQAHAAQQSQPWPVSRRPCL